jgi:hypothetical protein
VLSTIDQLRQAFPEVQLVGGNVATEEGARELVRRGVDAVKVGIGPGSICYHASRDRRRVPQITAIVDSARGADGRPGHRRRRHQVFRRRGQGARCGRRLGHDGLDAGRHRGKPGESVLAEGRATR